jgi:heat shock protein HslJ
MKKNILLLLFVLTVISFVTITYFAIKNTRSFVQAEIASSTPLQAIDNPSSKDYTTRTGKIITVENTHPNGESLSTITITSRDFASSSPITLEKNMLTNVFLADLNDDGFDELYLITEAAGSGSYGDITGFASNKDMTLVPIAIADIKEDDTVAGGIFEGYEGHDRITFEDGVLTREFPISEGDTASGSLKTITKKITYTLESEEGDYVLVAHAIKNVTAPLPKDSVAPASTSTSTSTKQAELTRTSGWVWRYTESTDGKQLQAPVGDKFVLTLKKDKTLSSTTDCNSLHGSYTISKDILIFSSLLSTLMFCENSQESDYVGKLAETMAYEIKGNYLHLILAKNGGTLVFTAK